MQLIQNKDLLLKDCMMTIGRCSNQIPALCISTKNLQLLVMDMFDMVMRVSTSTNPHLDTARLLVIKNSKI